MVVLIVQPDRPDEMQRVEAAGGRVVNWNGYRVLGVLATSRSIGKKKRRPTISFHPVFIYASHTVLSVAAIAPGDYYLKPYVSAEPEVTVVERTERDEFLILASDGLWDVVSNEVACKVVRTCLRNRAPRGGREQSSPTSNLSPRQSSASGGSSSSSGDEEAGAPSGDGAGSESDGESAEDRACAEAAILLTKLALARQSADNVSVVVVNLRRRPRS